MKYAVIEMRAQGCRLTREEIARAVPVIGDLRVSDWREGNSSHRILRKAELLEKRLDFSVPLLVLFEPLLLQVTERRMVLRGWQGCSDGPGGAVREYTQEWLIREVTPELDAVAKRGRDASPRRQMPYEGESGSESVGVVGRLLVVEEGVQLLQ